MSMERKHYNMANIQKFYIVCICMLCAVFAFAQPGEFDNETNASVPKVNISVYPENGGTVEYYYAEESQEINFIAKTSLGYKFISWTKDGTFISNERNMRMAYAGEDEVNITANFAYDATLPKVTLEVEPHNGGTIEYHYSEESQEIYFWVSPSLFYEVVSWSNNGEVISDKSHVTIPYSSGGDDINLLATLKYDPSSPLDPGTNYFNNSTGELIVDCFKPWNLYETICEVVPLSEFGNISSCIIAGEVWDELNFFYQFPNCSVIDLSRTNGYSSIDSNEFRAVKSLTDLILPSCINYIDSDAFEQCDNLSTITCLSLIPPVLSQGGLHNVDKSTVIKVPSNSISLYRNVDGWKDFMILPIDVETYSLTICLPPDANDGRYKNMSIELLNTSNGQRYKYLITDKTEYVFGNLLSATKYSVAVKNAKGDILGEISDLEINDEDLSTNFQELRQPKNVSVKVLTPDGSDVTSDVTIKWFNNADELLFQGSTMVGVLENSDVKYSITLSSNLSQSYLQPAANTITVSDTNTEQTCTLEGLGRVTLTGNVCGGDGSAINTAIITVSPNINGSYTHSEIAHCDKGGNYKLEVPNVPLKVTVSANGYIGQTKELQTAAMGIGEVVLEKNTGITLYPSFTLQRSVSTEDDSTTSAWLIDDSNIAYRVEDLNGNEIQGCIYQSGSIVLPDNIAIGDEVNVVAYSKTDKFGEVSRAIAIDSKNVYVSVSIVEYGGIRITVNDDTVQSSICVLYDKDGRQLRRASFGDNSVTFRNLPDGQYTVITMRKSSLMGSISNLSSLQETQLVEGTDYLLNKISVESGRIVDLAITDIPNLDETKLYYTDNDETYFMPNKSQVTIGNYIALKAKLTIKDEYAEAIDAATLVVDIPANCELVDNSIISGVGYLGYEYANGRLSIPVHRLSDAIRFCIVPLDGGECKLSAFVKLIVDNEEVLQPIGSAYFYAKNFSLATLEKTSKTTIAVRGTGTADSEVKVYDNGTLVGTTYSMPNGEWSLAVSLYKPYSKSIHELYGEITTKDGKRLLTQTKVVDYNQSYIDLSEVTMVYNNTNIIFDHLSGKNSVNSYSYVPGVSDFTFVVDFTENNPDRISNVVIKVLTSNGSVRSLPAEYNVTSGRWMARTKFTDSAVIPTNATADYDIAVDNNSYCEEAFNDQVEGLVEIAHYIEEQFDNKFSFDVSIDEDNRLEGKLVSGEESVPCAIAILDYDYIYNHLMYEKQFYLFALKDDEVYYNIEPTGSGMTCTIADKNEKIAFSLSLGSNQLVSNRLQNTSSLESNWTWISTLRQEINTGSFLNAFSNVACWCLNAIDIITAWATYRDVRADFNLMLDDGQRYADDLIAVDNRIPGMIAARCEKGMPRLTPSQIEIFLHRKDDISTEATEFSRQYYQDLNEYKWALGRSALFDVVTNIASLFIKSGVALLTKEHPGIVKWYGNQVTGNVNQEMVTNTLSSALGVAYADLQSAGKAVHPAFMDFNKVKDEIWTWANTESSDILKEYISLMSDIQNEYQECPKEEEEEEEEEGEESDDDFPTPPITPSIDPSGYVYEAVPSNRIQGVTATAYYKEQTEDMYGDITEKAVVWDAAPFGQENPLITDEEGKYAWDVPAGMWQVRFEKDGYEPAQSEWLPVPPPQLDVNIAMTQAKQPEVKAVHAYSDGVTIEFEKFMLPSSLKLGNIAVTQGGNVVKGEIESVDMQLDANGNAFCSKIEFKPETLLGEGEATLFVSKAVKSYANINMGEDFMQTFTVEPRVAEISVRPDINITSGSTAKLTASVLPASAAKGKTVLIESFNSIIAAASTENVDVNDDGKISFDVSGLIPGMTGIKLSIKDYDVNATVNVNVLSPLDENQVATPYASIPSGKIERGTEVYLYCDTEGASIYYTIDGSCPCDAGRLKYAGNPIVVEKDLTLKVIAEAKDMEDSEIAEYHYTVTSSGIGYTDINEALSIYPLPLGEYLTITNGGVTIDAVSIYNINGEMMLHSGKPQMQVTLNVGTLPAGVYILNVKTDGKTIAKKVIKR